MGGGGGVGGSIILLIEAGSQTFRSCLPTSIKQQKKNKKNVSVNCGAVIVVLCVRLKHQTSIS